ncbi:MAG: HAD hydrolase-like protein [Chloroflexi bacterium]|nr:HAD hydrolase-like protein [Chloroflexota bacterium]
MQRPRLVVFDMDGVLVDVSASYRPTIAATVWDYFSLVLALAAPPVDLVTPEEIDLLKRAGGLNNDWDMAAALIAYLLTLLPEAPSPPQDGSTTEAALHGLRRAAAGLTVDWETVVRRKDVASLAQTAAQWGGGLAGVQQAASATNRSLLCYRGTLRDTDLVTRLFQERYLGGDRFRTTYGLEPRLVLEEAGLCRRETLLVARETLTRLAERYPLGIATGRPRTEALFALEHLGVRDLFRCVITDDDIQEAEERTWQETGHRPTYRKPDPYGVLAALAGLGTPQEPGLYVGDVPDDIRAARAAGRVRPVLAVGCCAASRDREDLRQAFAVAGADLIVNDLEELVRWLLA